MTLVDERPVLERPACVCGHLRDSHRLVRNPDGGRGEEWICKGCLDLEIKQQMRAVKWRHEYREG